MWEKNSKSLCTLLHTWSYEGLVQLLQVVGGDDEHPALHLHHTVQHFQQIRQGQLSVGDKNLILDHQVIPEQIVS